MPRDGDPMPDTIVPTVAERRIPVHFEGFPYLVVRIGHTPLRHISLLPAELTWERLADIARRQVAANRLEACLALGPQEGFYVSPDGGEGTWKLQVAGIPVTGRLHLPGDVWVPGSDDLRRRERALAEFIEREGKQGGYLVGDGLEGGRKATADEVARLTVRDPDGDPPGLVRCEECGRLRGDFLAVRGEGNGDGTPRVIEVHCPCQNHNRCARCGETLHATRLSAYQYDEEYRRVFYTAAYCGLSHRCGDAGWGR